MRYLLFGLSCLLWARAGAEEGYTIKAGQIVIDTKAHWEKWKYPHGALDPEALNEGTIRPAYMREPEDPFDPDQHVNAVENIYDFEGYVDYVQERFRDYKKLWPYWPVRAGSNEKDGPNVVDGDPNTYWEPDPGDLLPPSFRERFYPWWIEVDLGRVVHAVRVVVKFVEEGKGDPFRQFKVYVSDGTPVKFPEKQNVLQYSLIGGTTKPNEDKRVFVFDLPVLVSAGVPYGVTVSGRRVDRDWIGDLVRYVRIEVSDWKEGTHPRLAEVEVWTTGDNVLAGAIKRGGVLREPMWGDPNNKDEAGGGSAWKVADGDIVNHWIAFIWSPYRSRGWLFVDLGATFWVDSYVLASCRGTVLNYPQLDGYIMEGSDGSRAPDGSLIWQRLSPSTREYEDRNASKIICFQDKFSLRKLRYFRFRDYDVTMARAGAYEARGTVAELLAYGRGYVPEIELESPLIELGGERNLSVIEWDADVPPGTRLEIQTRSGDELRQILHYYNKAGKEITPEQWARLIGVLRGPVDTVYVPAADWSSWSRVYERSGSGILSPSPRKYMKIRVRLLSDDPETCAQLRSIRVKFVQPVASKVLGEIWPSGPEGVELGREHEFGLYVRPLYSLPSVKDPRGSLGYDEVLILGPRASDMELDSLVFHSDTSEVRASYGHLLSEGEISKVARRPRRAYGRDELEVLAEGDSLWVRLPGLERGGQWLPLMYTRVVREVEVDSVEYARLKPSERGSVRYVEVIRGKEREVSLEYARGKLWGIEKKYYKKDPSASPEEVPFDPQGRVLTRMRYNMLPSEERGHIYAVGELMEVKFRGSVFMAGNMFKARLGRSDVEGSWQRIDPGDASVMYGSGGMVVSGPVEGVGIVGGLELVPDVVTPNGDGVNDQVKVRFQILKVSEPSEIKVKVYGMDGRVVRDLSGTIGSSASGSYEVNWNCRDEGGELVLPGIYIVKVSVRTDAGEEKAVRSLTVVF
ncbi:MAG TPA: hypothetical protein EYP61_08010 [Candidatus Latescibacteria bacterium]|nr:hypothetical protein [Candidatus Latescibacterota bacterium]